ncbi:MAG: efflux RND transporter periplasmic adaptor subunit [Burkholderiales bacterium]|nr:efflux RND transporter periplasmic adaptor subunit [Rhodocyclaceae bacterium]
MNFIKPVFRFLFRAKVLVPLIILVLGGLGFMQLQKKADEAKADRYRTVTVDKGAVIQRITANGTVNPVTVVSVGTQVSGTVTKLYTDFNQQVKAGQVLLELDPALIKANIAQIEATLRSAEASQRLAESTLKRNQELVRKGFISDATLELNTRDLDVARSNVSQIKSQLDRERTNLSYTVIRSPINGIVIDRKIDVGQTVAASFSTPTLFQIAQSLEAMQIDTSIAEADVGTVKPGMPVKFTVDAYPDREFVGSIRLVRLNATINQGVVTYNVIVDTANENQMLKPGMTAQVSFVAAQRDDVIRIPTAALRFKPPKDDKEDKKKKDAKAAEKKAEAKSDGKSEVSNDAAKGTPKTGGSESRQLAGPPAGSPGTGGGRRGVGTVYKVNDKNELVPVQVRTGIASNQHTELVSGELKAGDELVVRDLQDKSKK